MGEALIARRGGDGDPPYFSVTKTTGTATAVTLDPTKNYYVFSLVGWSSDGSQSSTLGYYVYSITAGSNMATVRYNYVTSATQNYVQASYNRSTGVLTTGKGAANYPCYTYVLEVG